VSERAVTRSRFAESADPVALPSSISTQFGMMCTARGRGPSACEHRQRYRASARNKHANRGVRLDPRPRGPWPAGPWSPSTTFEIATGSRFPVTGIGIPARVNW